MYSPTQHARIFGSGYVTAFTEVPVLTIGSDTWSRAQIAAMGVTQTVACGILSKIAKSLGVRHTKDCFARTSPYSFTEYRAGVTTLYVLFAAFADKGLDPAQWYQHQREGAVVVTFEHLKHREAKARAREREDATRRARSQRARRQRSAVRQTLNGATL